MGVPLATEIVYATDWLVWYQFIDTNVGVTSPAIARNEAGHKGRVELSVGKPTGVDFQTVKHPVHNGVRFDSFDSAQKYAFDNGLLRVKEKNVTAESIARTHTREGIERITEEMTGESAATRGVIRALLSDREMGSEWWEAMTYTSLEAFIESATSKLGDATEIEGAHLRDADWPSIYEEFKGMK